MAANIYFHDLTLHIWRMKHKPLEMSGCFTVIDGSRIYQAQTRADN